MKTIQLDKIEAKFSDLKSYQQNKVLEFLNVFSAINLIDTDLIAGKDMCCKNCGSTFFVKNGTYKRKTNSKKSQRYKCKNCGSTQFEDGDTALYNIKMKEKWVDFVYLMFDEKEPMSIASISKATNISERTGFRWRHKFLASLNQVRQLSTEKEQEIDEVYFPFIVKGTIGKEKFKEYISGDHENNIETELREKEKVMEDDKYQVIFLCRHNRMGDFDFDPIKIQKKGIVAKADLKRVMEKFDLAGTTVLTDREPSMIAYMKTLENVNHLTFKSSDLKKGILENKTVHNNNINSMMSHLRFWLKSFHGVSTKYLENYLKWFRFRKLFKTLEIKEMAKFSLDDKKTYPRFKNLFRTYEEFVYV